MPKVRVTVPAATINLGPGLDSLGLALALHNTIEMSLSPGSKSEIAITGLNTDAFPPGADHPVMKAVAAFAQAQKIAPPEVRVKCTSSIPAHSGLADHALWTVGGMAAINNLLDAPMKRDGLIAEASKLAEPAAVVTAMLGGLTITSGSGDDLLYRGLRIPNLQVVLVVPEIEAYEQQASKAQQKKVDIRDATFNIGRAALVVEALRQNDMTLLTKAMQDHVHEPHRKALIPGFDSVGAAGKQAGAAAVVLSGDGPALIAFASANHQAIELALRDAFKKASIKAQTWILNSDSQGITISVSR